MAARSDSGGSAPATQLTLDDPRWAAFVDAHPQALGYHNPAWAEVVASTYRFEAFVLATLDGDAVAAGLPVVDVHVLTAGVAGSACPFTDACPPLVGPGTDARRSPGARVCAAARGVPAARACADRRRRVAQAAEAVTHELPLSDDPDAIQAGFHHSHRRNIKRAAKEGVEVRRGGELSDLSRTFYALHSGTRHRLGVPVQPRRFFEAQWHRLVAPGHARLLLAYREDTAIAGMLLLQGNGTVTYKYGASDSAALDVRPNHALFAQAIRDACLEGNHTFDFGRTDFEDQGLRDFKAKWGGVETPLVYSALGGLDEEARGGRRLGQPAARGAAARAGLGRPGRRASCCTATLPDVRVAARTVPARVRDEVWSSPTLLTMHTEPTHAPARAAATPRRRRLRWTGILGVLAIALAVGAARPRRPPRRRRSVSGLHVSGNRLLDGRGPPRPAPRRQPLGRRVRLHPGLGHLRRAGRRPLGRGDGRLARERRAPDAERGLLARHQRRRAAYSGAQLPAGDRRLRAAPAPARHVRRAVARLGRARARTARPTSPARPTRTTRRQPGRASRRRSGTTAT